MQKSPKRIVGLQLVHPDNIFGYRLPTLHTDFTGAFRLWVRAPGNDSRTELTYNSSITVKGLNRGVISKVGWV